MRQPWWEWGVWFYRALVTQANGAGGAIVVDLVPVAGMDMIVVMASGVNSGTNDLKMERTDEDNNVAAVFYSVASAAGTKGIIPQSTAFSETSTLGMNTVPLETRIFRAGDKLTVRQTGAGAQNDTLLVVVRAFLSSAERPIVTKARSTNSGDVTIATPTVDAIR